MKFFAFLFPFLFSTTTLAFPWVANSPNVHSPWSHAHHHDATKRQQPGVGPGSAAQCPFNADHEPAAPITDAFPYNGAKDGLPGKGRGGYQVPAEGDTAHEFRMPGPNDIRGPCPGLNAAANHGFLARDVSRLAFLLSNAVCGGVDQCVLY